MPLILLNFIVWIVGISALISFILLLTIVNPFEAGIHFLIAFFVSLYLLLASILSLIGYYVREAINKKSHSGLLISSIRQSSLISLYLLSIIVMIATDTFVIWQAVLFLIVIFLLELYFR
jgi:hypothetical protein